MKVLKLVLGIVCICLAAFIIFQSCAAGVVDALEDSGGISGAAGFMVSILMIAGGIVMIATRNSARAGGSIAAAIIYAIAGVVGFSGAGIFKDLNIWAGLCIVVAIVNVIAAIKIKNRKAI